MPIDNHRIKQVLLSDGKWYDIVPSTFDTDSYDFQQQGLIVATEAKWKEKDADGSVREVFCPTTSIHALSYGWTGGRIRN